GLAPLMGVGALADRGPGAAQRATQSTRGGLAWLGPAAPDVGAVALRPGGAARDRAVLPVHSRLRGQPLRAPTDGAAGRPRAEPAADGPRHAHPSTTAPHGLHELLRAVRLRDRRARQRAPGARLAAAGARLDAPGLD